ncbi:MAG: tRNA pseudouridine(38-40) synthase TruA [Bacteroidota bacterium]|nr:tRNA pseudouridine(38-40) synthase TruA [Bacteroidota bacterium]
MPRYFIEVFYKGTKYSGYQVQQNAVTIQSEVARALQIRFRQAFMLTGSSRTDAGVHALQNYFHFDTVEELFYMKDNFSEEKNIERALYSLNSILPGDIVIKNIIKVDEKAHCRFDAISRHYKYYLYQEKDPFKKETGYFYPYTLNIEKLQEAAAIILNTKDFTSFSKRNSQVNNFICVIKKSEWKCENNGYGYSVISNRFLRGMVRGLVGTMLKVGTGKISLNQFEEIIKSNNCANADFSVPPQGLFLVEVKYPYKL